MAASLGKKAALGFGLALVAIQLIPYGRDHVNPPVTKEPQWNAPSTRAIARRACFDCHSNETTWPWYSSIAPASWFVQDDVEQGRSKVNFSEWDHPQPKAKDLVDMVTHDYMPPPSYRWLHSASHLTQPERDELARGLEAILATSPKSAE
ncbi:MAG: heme-binding domain-containing protein [Acidobacteriota bacterium]